jgi:peptidyl-prolyl cis-trans isomerase B (cyclophilin B)
MKSLAALAALLAVLQVTAPQRQAQPVRSPNGVLEPIAVLNLERLWSTAEAFWPLVKGDNIDNKTRRFAVRAIGRAEDPAQVTALLLLQQSPQRVDNAVAGQAIAQSLNGFDPVSKRELVDAAQRWLLAAAKEGETFEQRLASVARMAPSMTHIVYANQGQVSDIEALLAKTMDETANSKPRGGIYVAAIKGLEALARTNTKIVHYDESTIDRLSSSVKNAALNDSNATARLYAFMALSAARALDADTEKKALNDADSSAVRRVAMATLAGSGGGLEDEVRLQSIHTGLTDDDAQVRYEAVRAWIRHGAPVEGCAPLVAALKDDNPAVVLEAMDALGNLCLDDDAINKRLLAEIQVPGAGDAWNRPTRAFVALAKRSPQDAAIPMGGFVTNPNWWVRMYAAAAVAGAKEIPRLDKLAYDENDNVREVAIGFLRRLDKDRGAAATLAALDRADVSLLRTAATWLKEQPGDRQLVAPLVRALQRLTKDGRMTSRDGRVALLDAIERHAVADDMTQLKPWLRDYDPVVADRAAAVITQVSGRAAKAEPVVALRVISQPFEDLNQCVSIAMADNSVIRMQMLPDTAPVTVEHFLSLVADHYYDGLVFHRVVPNFVVQGGSPAGNEYAGSREYMRDEIGGRSHARGTVGLSTRVTHNTGDAQFFINLVDNPRLDMNYTVFAEVEDMTPVDRLQEGDVMRRVSSYHCGGPGR